MAMARAALESLLREKKLDLTLATARPWVTLPEDRVAATGLPEIDGPLGGGLRRGQLSEIVGPRSSGRSTVLCRLFAAATARGEVVALVDSSDRFDPSTAAEVGVDLSRLLWIRGHADPIRERADPARALKALNLVVQAGGFGVVAFDLADVPAAAIRQFPYTTWMRLSRVIEGSQTTLVLLGADRIARSPGGVTVTLHEQGRGPRGVWSGTGDRARFLAALEVQAVVR
jgi:recombination protein RecA